jgi:hypothetical protein
LQQPGRRGVLSVTIKWREIMRIAVAALFAALFAVPALAQPVNPTGAAISEDKAAASNAQANHAAAVANHDAAVGNVAGAVHASRVAHRARHRAHVEAHKAVAQDPAIAAPR